MEAPMTHAVTVRPVADHDDLDEINAGNERWRGAERERELINVTPAGIPVQLLVAEVGGRPVGNGLVVAAGVRALGYALGWIYVRADGRRRGAGRALFHAINEIAQEHGLPGVMYSSPDTDPDGAAVAARFGLVEHGHHIESRFDLTTLDELAVTQAVARTTAAGYVLESLPESSSEAAWLQAYEFLVLRMRESPDSEAATQDMPYSLFRALTAEPWQMLLARRDGVLAGITTLMTRPNEERVLNTMFTGVRPDARGHGVSAALKLDHARRVRDRGWREIVTQNMDQNAPILAVNKRMGFRPTSGSRAFGIAF